MTEGVELNDGAVWIADIDSFFEDTKARAVLLKEGQLFVLRSETLTWVSVEEVLKPSPKRGKLAVVKGEAK